MEPSPAAPDQMTTINLPGTRFRCSRFIFGTASLFNVGERKRRLHLLNAAASNGFSHFDTAPYYGFGMAERDLSYVLKDHPNVSVTTKVGLYPPGGEEQSFGSILARKALGRAIPAISRPAISFDIHRAQVSLEGSLRRLGREHIDLYMLHEPRIELLNTDEWRSWLEASIQAGKIGHFGVALTADRLEALLNGAPGLAPLVQVQDSLDRKEANLLERRGKPLQITYGYVSAARSRGDPRPVAAILKQALDRNPDGAIIVSTRRPERLAQYAEIAEGAR